MKFALIIATVFLILSPSIGYSEEYSPSFYFAGYVRHAKPTPRTHEGSMDYLGFSVEYKTDGKRFDTGIGTYIDSYDKRSYNVFSDISDERFIYGNFRPLLGFYCSYKGRGYDTSSMKLLCFPLLKFRVGGDDGLFTKITAIPHIGTITNGLISAEFGYKW